MSEKRAPIYQNLVRLKGFFGEEIETVLDGFNLQTRRLNKSYLQGLEEKSRQLGLGGVMSSTIASMSRGHIDLGTIRIYLRDHNLSGEDASTVLYMMMERGVLGFELYHAVLTSYPESFAGLTMKQQNELLTQLNLSPLELEIAASETLAQEEMRTSLLTGNKQSTLSILTALFAICQGEGRGKDEGTYCFRRSRGEICNHGRWESCVANACHDSILTQMGVLPMLKTL